MPQAVADLFVVLDSITDPFSKGLKSAAADAEGQSKRMASALKTVAEVGVGLGAAVIGVGVASVKAASTFNAQMAMISTQAGVSKGQIASLSDGVLNLAGQVGFNPDSLAEALFHIESSFASTGITGTKALDLLKISAEGAAIGHANLVDVTNALDAAIASGIPGVQDYSQAMGVLNSVVGSGDMTMQDLANSFSTGALANVKSYGASITDVGAALAVFGDNNIRGQNAATDLRMSMQALQVPAATASTLLAKMGMDAHTLGDTMSQGGLLPTLELLHEKLTALGYTEKTQGAALTELFGKKAGAGIVVLYDQLDRLKSKYPDEIKGATGLADAWATTKQQMSQQFKEIEAGADVLAIRLGNVLIPQLSKLIGMGQSDLGQLVSGFTGSALKPVAHDPAHSAFMNQELSTPSLTGWQRFGEEAHRILTDVETDAKKLEPIGRDFLRFGDEVYQGATKLVPALEPTAKLLGTGLLAGLEGTGKVLADVVGPAFKDFADFLDGHQRMIEYFAVTVLGGLALKMTILGGINAVRGVLGLATAIVQFPLQQTGQITTAWKEMQVAWTGQEAAQGEQAIQGLSGAFTNLKGAASGALDKVLPNSANMAGLAQMSQDFQGIGIEAKAADEQLALFATTEKGIVQAADAQQLSLFDQDLGNIEMTAGNAAGALGQAETASEGLAGKLGKFALAGGVIGAAIVGIQMLDQAFGHLMGVGSHAADSVEQYAGQLQMAANGSLSAADGFAKSAVQMALTSHLAGQQVTGMKNIDAAMAQMVSGGNAQAARDEFARIADALGKQGFNAQQAADEFPQYERALKDAGTAAATMTGQVQNSIDTMQHAQALDQFTSDVANLTQTITDNGRALSGNSAMANQNKQAFRGMALEALTFYQDQINAHVPMDQANQDLTNQYNQLEAVGIQFLGSKKRADDFLNSLGMIKPSYSTSINLDTSHAVSTFNGLLDTINSSTATVHVAVSQSGLGISQAHGAATPGFDGGGFANWATGAPRLAVLHGGEYVVSNDMRAGRQPIDPRVLTGMRGGAGLTGYASGSGGGATVVNNYYFTTNVAGSVTSEAKLADVVRTQVLQYKNRNSGNGLG